MLILIIYLLLPRNILLILLPRLIQQELPVLLVVFVELDPRLLLLLRLLDQLLNAYLVLRIQGILLLLGSLGADMGVVESLLVEYEAIGQSIVRLPAYDGVVSAVSHEIGTGRLELLGRMVVSANDALQVPRITLQVILLHGLPATVIVPGSAPAQGLLLALDGHIAQLESHGRHRTGLLNSQQVVLEIVAVLLSQDFLFVTHGQFVENLLRSHFGPAPHATPLETSESVAELLSREFFEG